MPKGKPRTATAAVEILRQQAEPQKAEVAITEGEITRSSGPLNDGTPVAYKPVTKGVKAGLRQGETRVTCIFTEAQNQVLHDWAKTTGRTFREVCLAMAERYIEEVIRPATSGDRKLNNTGVVPEAYADMYDAETPDEWAQFF